MPTHSKPNKKFMLLLELKEHHEPLRVKCSLSTEWSRIFQAFARFTARQLETLKFAIDGKQIDHNKCKCVGDTLTTDDIPQSDTDEIRIEVQNDFGIVSKTIESKGWLSCRAVPRIYADDDHPDPVLHMSNALEMAIRYHQYHILAVTSEYPGYHERMLWKYNRYTNEWTGVENMKFMCSLPFSMHYSRGINSEQIHVISENGPIQVQLETIHFQTPTMSEEDREVTFLLFGICYSCIIDRVIHIIGNKVDLGATTGHIAYNLDGEGNKQELITDFAGDSKLEGFSLIHIPSKQMMLMIGGVVRNFSESSAQRNKLGIWQFCLVSKGWMILKDLDFNYRYVRSVLSSNEDYIIIAGGQSIDGRKNNKIFVLDIRDENRYILRECTIKCPKPGICEIVRIDDRVKDELLMIGWVRELFKTKEFKNLTLPPFYLMKMMSLWYDQEMIHCFWNLGTKHQAIALDNILSSLL